nr:fibronectin type III-like domain-contianing protein [uncultured Allomuricauda sp.]
MLKKGERREVTITLYPDDLKFYNAQHEFVSEPGVFEVFVGSSSNADLSETFTLK